MSTTARHARLLDHVTRVPERGREILRLRLGSSMRSVERQDNTDACPLFEAANEPGFL